MTGRKILFVIPRNKSLFGDKVNLTGHPHVGVAYLVSFLRQKGITIDIFDEGIDSNTANLLAKIKEFGPDLIGVTIFSYCYGFANNLIRHIKRNCDIPVVLGGPHVSAVGSNILEENEADFAIKGEGEYPLLELLSDIGNQDYYDRIKGLIWRNGGKIVENIDRPYIQNLDELPLPAYEAFDIKRYTCFSQGILPLITSRGCPFGCNYCSVRLSMGQGFRPRSAENVFEEIRHFINKGFSNFAINDDCFTLDKSRAGRICDLIIENKLDIKFQLYNGIRVDTVDKSLLKKMKDAGCYFISYGCEAGTDKILKIIKKGITLQQVRDAVAWTNEVGIRNSVNFIIGHTQESYQDALATISFAKSLPTDFVNFFNLIPYPGTESFSWVKEHARTLVPLDSFLEDISYRDNRPIFETEQFSKQQREKVIFLGFDLYRKKILTLRLGKVLGNLVYFLTSHSIINKFATRFALTNPLGRFIYMRISRRSIAKEPLRRDSA